MKRDGRGGTIRRMDATEWEAMHEDYDMGMSLSEVAEKFGRHRQNVWSGFRRRGWATRSRIEGIRNRSAPLPPKAAVTNRRPMTFEGGLDLARSGRRGDECWEWPGRRTPAGYGRRAGEYAHRVSFSVHYGEDPGRRHVCHSCDNPPCINPGHLFLGTASDNSRDMVAKGRSGTARLTPDTVDYIRERYRSHSRTWGAIPLARALGVSPSAIVNAARGRTFPRT